jgi:hypothetical protein
MKDKKMNPACTRTCQHMQDALELIHELTGSRFEYHFNLFKFVHTHGLEKLKEVYQYERGQGHQPEFMAPHRLLSPKRIDRVLEHLARTPLRERAKAYLRAQGSVYIRSEDIDYLIVRGMV